MIDSLIQEYEKHFEDAMPSDLREWLVTNDGIEDAWLQYDSQIDSRSQIIDAVYGLSARTPESVRIDTITGRLAHALPKKAIPVASSLGGIMIVFFVSVGRPGVFYWHHERDIGDKTVDLVAKSFVEFVGELRIPDED